MVRSIAIISSTACYPMLLYQNNYRMDKPVFTTSNLNKRKKLIKCRELTLARSLQMEILIQSWIANQPASPPPCDMRHCLCIRIITNPTTIIAIDTNRCKFIISRKLTLDIGITAKIPNEFTWKKNVEKIDQVRNSSKHSTHDKLFTLFEEQTINYVNHVNPFVPFMSLPIITTNQTLFSYGNLLVN